MKKIKCLIIPALICVLAAGVLFAQEAGSVGEESGAKDAAAVKAEKSQNLYIGEQFSYDRGDRRDPFKSLMVSTEIKKEREVVGDPGIAGCLVQELVLQGVMKIPAGVRAMVIACDGKGYWIKAGDKLYNGEVLGISLEDKCVTFRQEVNDPLAIKPFTDVSKCLSSGGENK